MTNGWNKGDNIFWSEKIKGRGRHSGRFSFLKRKQREPRTCLHFVAFAFLSAKLGLLEGQKKIKKDFLWNNIGYFYVTLIFILSLFNLFHFLFLFPGFSIISITFFLLNGNFNVKTKNRLIDTLDFGITLFLFIYIIQL